MKTHKILWRITGLAALLAGCFCAGYAGWYGYQQYAAEQQYEQLQRQMEEAQQKKRQKLKEIEAAEFVGEVDGPEPELPDEVILAKEKGSMENPIDFERLEEINPELYAWIFVPGTRIDYPVAQHADQDQTYYLKHNMYGEPEFAGCIYTETGNRTDFTDRNTVIYGHNMKNGSMFQNLHRFADEDFFEKNTEVLLYLPDRILQYEIFAAYESDDRHILKSYDFNDPDVFAEYIRVIQGSRALNVHVREELEIGADDRIITLSTCVGGKPDSRFLVQAVLKQEYAVCVKKRS